MTKENWIQQYKFFNSSFKLSMVLIIILHPKIKNSYSFFKNGFEDKMTILVAYGQHP